MITLQVIFLINFIFILIKSPKFFSKLLWLNNLNNLKIVITTKRIKIKHKFMNFIY